MCVWMGRRSENRSISSSWILRTIRYAWSRGVYNEAFPKQKWILTKQDRRMFRYFVATLEFPWILTVYSIQGDRTLERYNQVKVDICLHALIGICMWIKKHWNSWDFWDKFVLIKALCIFKHQCANTTLSNY